MNPIFIGANIQNIHHLAHTPPIFYTKTRIKYIFKKEHPLNAPLSREFHITFFASPKMTKQKSRNTSRGAQH